MVEFFHVKYHLFFIICKSLPFEASLNIIQGTLHNDFSNLSLIHILVFIVYFIVVILLSIIIFKKRMVSDNK